jgi:hypothetical protein
MNVSLSPLKDISHRTPSLSSPAVLARLHHHGHVITSTRLASTTSPSSLDHATAVHPYRWESTAPTPLTASELAAFNAVYPTVRREVLLVASSSLNTAVNADPNVTLLTRLCERLQLPLVSSTSQGLIREISLAQTCVAKKSDEFADDNISSSNIKCAHQTTTPSVLPIEVCLRVVEKLKTLHRLWLFAVYQRARGGGGGGRHGGVTLAARHHHYLPRRSLVADDVIEALLSLADSGDGSIPQDQEDVLDRLIPLKIVLDVLEVFDIASSSMREGLSIAGEDNIDSSPAASPTTTHGTQPRHPGDSNVTTESGPTVRIRDVIDVLLDSRMSSDGGTAGSPTGDALGDPSEDNTNSSATPDFLSSLVDTTVGGGLQGGHAGRAPGPQSSMRLSHDAVWEQLLLRHAMTSDAHAASSPRLQRAQSSTDASVSAGKDTTDHEGDLGTPDPRSITPGRSPPPLPPLAARARIDSEVVAPPALTSSHFYRGTVDERPWFQLSEVDVPNRTDAHKLLDDGDGSTGGITRRSHYNTARRLTGRLSVRAGSLTPVPAGMNRENPSPAKNSAIRSSATPSSLIVPATTKQTNYPEPIGVASHHALQHAEFVRYRTTYKQVRVHQFR